jgi:hypothetical protein
LTNPIHNTILAFTSRILAIALNFGANQRWRGLSSSKSRYVDKISFMWRVKLMVADGRRVEGFDGQGAVQSSVYFPKNFFPSLNEFDVRGTDGSKVDHEETARV